MELLVDLHSVWRWAILLLGVAALLLALLAATERRAWDRLSDRFSFFYTLALDVQVLIGVVVWIVRQQWGGDPVLAWLHPLAMLAAVGLAHVGRARSDRAADSPQRGRAAAPFFAASLVVVLAAIPLYSWLV